MTSTMVYDTNTSQMSDQPMTWRISGEMIAYAMLIFIALVLRLAELDSMPLSDAEAQQAVATLHIVDPNLRGEALVPHSPIMFWWQAIAFSFGGTSEFTARLGGLIGGMVLILMPLLFRRIIGRDIAFLMSAILATSPVMIVTARTNDPAIWTLILTLGALIALWRSWYERQPINHIIAIVFGMSAIFLSAPDAPLLALVLLMAGWFTAWWMALRAPQDLDVSGEVVLNEARLWLRSFAWQRGLVLSLALIVVISTGFMIYPAGLGHVAQLLTTTLNHLTQPAYPNVPSLWTILTLITYEWLLLVFALIGTLFLAARGAFGLPERFAVMWVVVGLFALMLYRGAVASDALWIVVPLAYLAARAARECFINHTVMLLWSDFTAELEDASDNAARYAWVKWALSVGVLALLIMISLHVQEVARGLAQVPISQDWVSTLRLLLEPMYLSLRYSAIWMVISAMFLVVGFFFAASFWGNRHALQGLGLGALWMLLLSGMGGGWNASVVHSTQGGELWYPQAVTQEASLLRQTLHELSQRDTGGFPHLTITVVTNGRDAAQTSLWVWLLRGYPNITFVTTMEQAHFAEMVIMPHDERTIFDLGGDYVGQRFVLHQQWYMDRLRPTEWLAWWFQRRLPLGVVMSDPVALWLRQDVYDGVPLNERRDSLNTRP